MAAVLFTLNGRPVYPGSFAAFIDESSGMQLAGRAREVGRDGRIRVEMAGGESRMVLPSAFVGRPATVAPVTPFPD